MLSLVCYRDQSANEEKAFFESLQMSFDEIKSCNYDDTSSPNADIGIRVFIFVATTHSSSRHYAVTL